MRAWLTLALLAACGDGSTTPIDGPDVVGLEAGVGVLTANPTTFDFGSFAPGDAAYQLTITNAWVIPTAPLSLTLSGPDPGAFFIQNDLCSAVRLADGMSCTVELGIRCSSTTRIYDAVLVIGAMPGGSVAVPLRGKVGGKSCGAFFTVNPGNHAFGDQAVGTTSASRRFTFVNFGGKPSAPIAQAVAGADPNDVVVTATTCAGTVVPPGGTCTIDMAFAPQSLGAKQATVTLVQYFTTVQVSGTGVSPASARR